MSPGLFRCFGRGCMGRSPEDAATADQASEELRRGGAVLVELFSSQGCATSPEAEVLLSRLGRGDLQLEVDVPVVAMAYHVDYWDHLGWKDPFASSMWSVRQKAYVEALRLDTLYTPQLVVQGRSQCLATDHDAIVSALHSADRFPPPAFQATFQRPSPELLQVAVTGVLRTGGKGAEVMVALCESGLVTDCNKGENRGRVLSNDFVVRGLHKLSAAKDVSLSSKKKIIAGTLDFPLWEGFTSTKCGLVIFIQNTALQVYGTQRFQLPDDL